MYPLVALAEASYDLMTRAIADIVEEQLAWYAARNAGCAFAALAARDPARLGWRHVAIDPGDNINRMVAAAAIDPQVEVLSLLAPHVRTGADLVAFVGVLRGCTGIWLEIDQTTNDGVRCLGFRARIGPLTSWISGFGPMDFMPATRRAPCVELAIRTKPRPNYPYVLKESPPDVIHLADLNMRGIKGAAFRAMWDASFRHTARRLGHPPDVRTAAKTTFAIPAQRFT
jgi:hypothetical protein